MAEQPLGELQIARRVQDALTGGVAGLVHPLAARFTCGDDASLF